MEDDSDHEEGSDLSSVQDHSHSHVSSTLALTRSGSADKKGSSAVKMSRFLLAATIVVCVIIIAVPTHLFLSREQQRDFETQYRSFATELSYLISTKADNAFLAASGLSTAATSFAIMTNSTWPFVALPDFETMGREANEISNTLLTALCPIVDDSTKDEWEKFSVTNQNWILDALNSKERIEEGGKVYHQPPIASKIYRRDNTIDDGDKEENGQKNTEGSFLPVWQLSPAPRDVSIINYDLLSNPVFSRVFNDTLHTGHAVFSEVLPLNFLYDESITENKTSPHSFIFHPVQKIFKDDYVSEETNIAAFIISILQWDQFFKDLLRPNVTGIMVVLQDTCKRSFTYIINGMQSDYIGQGDLHDTMYDYLVIKAEIAPPLHSSYADHQQPVEERCEVFLNIYPTAEFESKYRHNTPALLTVALVLVFVFTVAVFGIYNFTVKRRHDKIMATALRSSAIVSSLFPSIVHDRLLKEAEQANRELKDKSGSTRHAAPKSQLHEFLVDETQNDNFGVFDSKPIADLFPNATVMFADIAGFTAWSSMREPTQVFQLLETIYDAFDARAKQRRVFKVETIGDCYVAVAGLPDRRSDHAIVMARFARDCLTRMNDLSRKLELLLGPDTGDLCMRIGLNSGPVTAGVLRGEKSRFQLFGDTVNTAARMESNGERNRVHISQETADLLCQAGKSHWVTARQDKILAKGKGELQTYWLDLKQKRALSMSGGQSESSDLSEATDDNEEIIESPKGEIIPESTPKPVLSGKANRLVSWNVDVLARLLKQIIARRNASAGQSKHSSEPEPTIETEVEGKIVMDEVAEIIELPHFDAKAMRKQEDPKFIQLDPLVTVQLNDYITAIATMYHDKNPFHNFEHASHVTMSVTKLLSRIVAPSEVLDEADDVEQLDKNLHDHTYGITSDPLTQFAVVFSALIHDADHPGVPNAQLVKEKTTLASIYRNKSVAEQNSVDLAWDILMDYNFKDLRAVIYTNKDELKRFRQLIVNAVMATDIVDKELKVLRNMRWDKAFQESQESALTEKESQDCVNRKATIVIEHLIQASDIAHTMQHWHIYRKWNERFFEECLQAYKANRAENNPVDSWYQGELGFFDFYIIPLAKKLRDCGVFGVSCDEYLNYAMANRKEWELKGKQIVAEMAAKHNA